MTNITYGDFIQVDTDPVCHFAPILAEQMRFTFDAVRETLPPGASIKLGWTATVTPQ